MKLRTLDLFSGIGGFSLGLQRTGGFETIAFCEIDPFCRKVLAKHWPGVPCFEDITKVGKEELDSLGRIDVICGGFPCQDISYAGKGAGIHAERSGLWWEMLRIIRLVRPKYVLVENVAALLNRGLDEVLGSLAESGYDAEWQVLRACDFGLPHRRERIFIIANPKGTRGGSILRSERIAEGKRSAGNGNTRNASDAVLPGLSDTQPERQFSRTITQCDWGQAPSAICGMDDVVPNRVDRLRALGNAIVPQCATYIAECVLKYQEALDSMEADA